MWNTLERYQKLNFLTIDVLTKQCQYIIQSDVVNLYISGISNKLLNILLALCVNKYTIIRYIYFVFLPLPDYKTIVTNYLT